MKVKVSTCFILLFNLICFCVFSQTDTTLSFTFDFNEHQYKEVNDKIKIKPVNISLTEDRFGNAQSSIYLHGHANSYLNLGTSPLLKPKLGTIAIWVNLDRKVYAGTGSESNPIIITKNGPQDDFYCAYGLYYDLKNNRFGAIAHKDSAMEVNLMSNEEIVFNKWYHLVYVIAKDHFSFYVNGKLQQSAPKKYEINYYALDSVVIGNGASKKNERWCQGIFDDIQLFHRELSDKEIDDLYHAPNPNRLKNIVNEIIKYGIIVLILVGIIVFLIIRNRRALKKQKEYYELNNRINELEIKVIKAQMNPHFVSNCLAAIQDLILMKDFEKAVQYVAKFSFFLRQILNYSDKTFISIEEEISIIKLNIELEELRFKNNIDFVLNINENIDITEQFIPSLITQPFIENAIWHGLLPLNNIREPRLIVNVFKKGDLPVIEIEDNGVGRKRENNHIKETSKGTKMILEKLDSINRLTNSTHYTLEIVDLHDANGQTGTKIIIQFANNSE